MKTFTLNRIADDGVQTLGTMYFNDFVCNTLEKPYKDNQRGISSIPRGIYECKWTFSPKFLRYTYEVLNVPNRSAIRIHKGNYFFDIQGCILLGDGYSDLNKDGKQDILNSTVTIKKFEALLNKQTFKLKII